MIDTLKEHIVEVENFNAHSKAEIEAFRIKYLGKKGLLNDFFAEFKNVPNDQKKEFGQTINQLKSLTAEKVNTLNEALESKTDEKSVYGDLTRPGEPIPLGARHPISIVKNQIIEIFSRISSTPMGWQMLSCTKRSASDTSTTTWRIWRQSCRRL